MFKRIWLFLLTNLAVIVLLNIVFLVLEKVLGVPVTGYGYFIVLAATLWFWGAFISLFISRWMAKKAYNIVLITPENVSKLDEKEKIVYDTVVRISLDNRITLPEIGIYTSDDANAFATGYNKNNALVAVSTGLLNTMNKEEIEGVIAHEMAHILNGDMITMTLLQWVLNTLVIFASRVIANIVSQFVDEKLATLVYFAVSIILEIIFGLLASIIVMAFSRHREFRADEGSARFVGKEKMIAALKALQKTEKLAPESKGKFATMQISTHTEGGIKSWFMSHPSLESRIENLQSKF